MTLIITALTIGILGSVHCIGMCGPIALALPLGNKSGTQRLAGTLIYNSGRILTYSVLGFIFGIFGKLLFLAGLQQALSIAVGAIILIYLLIPSSWFSLRTPPFIMQLFVKLKSKMSGLFRQRGNGTLFLIGTLNGLLPCGLVYTALAGASIGGSGLSGALFMAAFGLATTPVMFLIPFFKNKVNEPARKVIRRTVPYITAAMAVLFILRGLNLGVPYISPKIDTEKATFTSCCSTSHHCE